jgi:Tol biopolymer transport system component
MAQPFDPGRLELSGEPQPIADGIQTYTLTRSGLFSVSRSGALVYQAGAPSPGSQLVWFDRTGKMLATVGEPADSADVSLSPDGNKAATTVLDPVRHTGNIWIIDLARGGLRTQFTFGNDDEQAPVWSPDGSRIVFGSRRGGRWGMYQKPSNGAGTEEALFEFPPGALVSDPLSWTSDARSLLFVAGTASAAELSVLPLTGDHKPVTYLSRGEAGPGQFSPDSRWIAHTSSESGRSEVYVSPHPNRGGKWLVSTTGGGTQPRWRRDGKEIFYVGNSSKIFAAEVTAQGDAFQVGAVRPLFDIRIYATRYAYDVSPNGQRFLVNTRIENQARLSTPLTVVVNWPAALSR